MSTAELNRFNSLQTTSNWATPGFGNCGADKEFIPRTENVKNLPQGR